MDNPYESPTTRGEARMAHAPGIPFHKLTGRQWLVVFEGWLTVLATMFAAPLVLLRLMEIWPQPLGRGWVALGVISALVSSLVGGRLAAIAYKRIYVRIAQEIARRNGESN